MIDLPRLRLSPWTDLSNPNILLLNACQGRLVSELLYRTDILSRLSTQFAERRCGNRQNGACYDVDDEAMPNAAE